jgi:NADH:quinone reductase (non-electrogenic)
MHTTFAARQGSGPVNARPRVVIVGAGFAGLNAARALRHADADVTIVDGHDYHTFHPLLYQVSTGYLAPEEVGAALRAVFRRQANVRVRVGRRTGWTTRAVHSCSRTVPRSASTT